MPDLTTGNFSPYPGERDSGETFSDAASFLFEKEAGSVCYAVGKRESARAVRRKRAQRVFVAEDAASRVVAPLVDECRYRGVEIVFVPSKAELGKMAGIERGASIVCVLKQDK